MCSFEELRSRSDLIFELDVLADFLEVKRNLQSWFQSWAYNRAWY